MKCDAPISIRFKNPVPDGKGGFIYYFPAGCGKCLPCLKKRKAQWSFRMVEEKRRSLSSCFVTLTYEDRYLPIGLCGSTVNPQDHKEFIKKLKEFENPKVLRERKQISEEELYRFRTNTGEFAAGFKQEDYPLRYYGVSEYGDKNGRSHWHYILFNVRDFNNINLAWPYGRVQIDECNVNTIDYTLKYMIKDHSNQDYENKSKERSFMSKGIGSGVADQEFIDYIKLLEGNQVISERGHKVGLPRYYTKKYLSEVEAKEKCRYLNALLAEQEIQEDNRILRQGRNPDMVHKLEKDERRYLIQNRKKRDHG